MKATRIKKAQPAAEQDWAASARRIGDLMRRQPKQSKHGFTLYPSYDRNGEPIYVTIPGSEPEPTKGA